MHYLIKMKKIVSTLILFIINLDNIIKFNYRLSSILMKIFTKMITIIYFTNILQF